MSKDNPSSLADLLKTTPSLDEEKPLHPESMQVEIDDKEETKSKELTSKKKKTKVNKVGRKPSNNEAVNFRCPTAAINLVEDKIAKLNAKGMGLDFREVMKLLVIHASELSPKDFKELVIAARNYN